MRIKIILLLIVILASNLLFGCTSPVTPDSISLVEDDKETQPTLLTSIPTDSPPFTPTAVLPIKEESSPTLKPEPTDEPTPTPTISPTPEPQFGTLGEAQINMLTIDSIKLLDKIGNGKIQEIEYNLDAGVFILQTSMGIYLYAGESLDRLAFFEGCLDAYSVPGKAQIVAVTPEQTMILIDLNTAQEIQTMVPEGIHGIGKIAFSQNGKVMGVAVVQDHEVRLDWEQYGIEVWNLEQNKPIAKLISDLFGICTSMAFTEDNTKIIADCYTAGFSMYKKLVLWDISQQEIVWYLSNAGMITKYPFSRDGSLFATFSDYQPDVSKVYVRRTNDGAEVARFSGRLSDNAFSHDSQHIVTSSIYTQVKVWDIKFSYAVTQFATGMDWPSVSYSKDGLHILVNDGEQAWDASEFVLDQDFKPDARPIPTVTMSQWRQQGHLSDIRGVQVLDDQEMLVWGFSENEYIWWLYPDKNLYGEVSVGTGKGQPVLSPDHNRFAVCTDEGLKIFSIDQKTFETYGYCKMDENFLVFSKDGDVLFLSSGILIDVISVNNGEIVQQLRSHEYNVGNLQISEDGNYLVTSNATIIRDGCETILWELIPVRFVRKWRIPVQPSSFKCLISGKFDHNGSNLVTVHDKVAVWRISDGWYLKYFDGTTMAFSQDDTLLAVGTRDSRIIFYETEKWEIVETVGASVGQQSPVPSKDLLFVNQGRLLISILHNDVIMLWGVP